MWRVIYSCTQDEKHMYQCDGFVDRDPITKPPKAPKCVYCDRAMTLAKVVNLTTGAYTASRRKRTRKGFGAAQVDLLSLGTDRRRSE